MKKIPFAVVAGIGIFSAVFYTVTGILMRRWTPGEKKADPAGATGSSVPVTFFRPIKKAEPGLEQSLRLFLRAVGPADQVIFSATGSDEHRLCCKLAGEFPALDITCEFAVEGIHRNPKINKLAQMEPLARHAKWIILDSDALADSGFLEAFRREWQASDADAISAPYTFQASPEMASRLDALGTGLALWPGVALLNSLGKMDFLTGACIGVHAPLLQRLGGWSILGGSLADDHELGLLLHRNGGRIAIASTVLTLHAPRATPREWLLHQHRAFVTFRLCNPLGSLGIPLTHGVGIIFLCALLNPSNPALWLLHPSLLLVRWVSAKSLPGQPPRLRDVWLASLFEPLFWILAWLPLPVFWNGRWIKPEKS